MPGKFAEITFTPSVKAAQERYRSRAKMQTFEGLDTLARLGAVEQEFLASRDFFYQATVTEDGWPYVQFRGGPAGFLKVLDDRHLGYADFRGNRQYISVGNMTANDRVALIAVDYPSRLRLKVWARAEIIHANENPDTLAALSLPDYRAKVERGVILTVEAYDWNCPQHITPRYTEHEVQRLIEPMQQRIADLEAEASNGS